RAASLLGACLRTAYAIQPALGTRLAARLFFTPLPSKLAARRQRLPSEWVPEAWPFERTSLTLYRRRDAGPGPVALLVHGWGGHGLQMQALGDGLAAAGLQPVLLDFPAHGRSGGWSSTLPQFLRALEYVAARLGGVHSLVAHSLGALAAAAAQGRGLAAQKLVLLAPSPSPNQVTRWFAGSFGLDDDAHARMQSHIEAREGLLLDSFEPDRLAPRLAAPILLIHDREDRMAPFANSERWAALAPQVTLSAVAGLGHRRLLADAGVIDQVRRWCTAKK
ncbi:MAG TPA: alpha/beta fold hydrolase, partial [Methylibium sp.]